VLKIVTWHAFFCIMLISYTKITQKEESMRLVTILNKTLKFKSFGFEKSKFGKKIKKQGQRQQTIEIEIERLKRLHQLITTYNQGNKVILGMEG
jgi:hypothetical protein